MPTPLTRDNFPPDPPPPCTPIGVGALLRRNGLEPYIVAQIDVATLILISLVTGRYWASPTQVANINKITAKEANDLGISLSGAWSLIAPASPDRRSTNWEETHPDGAIRTTKVQLTQEV